MKQLKEKCGMECGDETVLGLLFAVNTCVVVSDAPGIKRSLDVLWIGKRN